MVKDFIWGEENQNQAANNKYLMKARGRSSQQTKASSSQSAAIAQKAAQGKFEGWRPDEAVNLFHSELTEFEKLELQIYDKIYTIG